MAHGYDSTYGQDHWRRDVEPRTPSVVRNIHRRMWCESEADEARYNADQYNGENAYTRQIPPPVFHERPRGFQLDRHHFPRRLSHQTDNREPWRSPRNRRPPVSRQTINRGPTGRRPTAENIRQPNERSPWQAENRRPPVRTLPARPRQMGNIDERRPTPRKAGKKRRPSDERLPAPTEPENRGSPDGTPAPRRTRSNAPPAKQHRERAPRSSVSSSKSHRGDIKTSVPVNRRNVSHSHSTSSSQTVTQTLGTEEGGTQGIKVSTASTSHRNHKTPLREESVSDDEENPSSPSSGDSSSPSSGDSSKSTNGDSSSPSSDDSSNSCNSRAEETTESNESHPQAHDNPDGETREEDKMEDPNPLDGTQEDDATCSESDSPKDPPEDLSKHQPEGQDECGGRPQHSTTVDESESDFQADLEFHEQDAAYINDSQKSQQHYTEQRPLRPIAYSPHISSDQAAQITVYTSPQHVPRTLESGFSSPAQSGTQNMVDRNVTTNSMETLLDKVKLLVLCSTCRKTCNRAVVCHEYQIQLNRPVQCACGCVICTMCYREREGCHVHIVSRHGPVNITASDLESCSDLENIGHWDIELEMRDQFMPEADINKHVQWIMNGPDTPDMAALKNAFEVLINDGDNMSFKYWANEPLPEDVAYRYVCIPHIPGFWDHVLVGIRSPPKTEKMIAPDDFLPKLFNVYLGPYKFHWCCFVFRKQIILAMWCTVPMGEQLKPKVCPVVIKEMKTFTTGIEFRRMVFYLAKWFTVQYGVDTCRRLKVVLDCKPSEGSLVHIMTLLASKSGMDRVIPTHQHRHHTDMTYTFNLRDAAEMFTSSPAVGSASLINIVDEFEFHNGVNITQGHMRMNTKVETFHAM